MEEEPRRAVEGVAPDELEQVAEHLDDPVPDTAPAGRSSPAVRFVSPA